jgi:hypothetical protein
MLFHCVLLSCWTAYSNRGEPPSEDLSRSTRTNSIHLPFAASYLAPTRAQAGQVLRGFCKKVEGSAVELRGPKASLHLSIFYTIEFTSQAGCRCSKNKGDRGIPPLCHCWKLMWVLGFGRTKMVFVCIWAPHKQETLFCRPGFSSRIASSRVISSLVAEGSDFQLRLNRPIRFSIWSST